VIGANVASELDTRLVMRPLRNTERVLRNAAVDRLLEKEKALGADLKFDDNIDEAAGLIRDVPTVKALIDRIMVEAETIIGQRLARFAAA
jgi:nitronate monooxygenase